MKMVEHQEIPDDEAHCPCFGFYGTVTVDVPGGGKEPTITNHPCDCDCHDERKE